MNRAKKLTARLMLEAAAYPWSDFLTFTFKEEPPGDRELQVREAQLLIKRIREKCSPKRIRHFTVGEYGTARGRFHYHSILFSLRESREFYESVWPYGYSYVGPTGCSPQACAYVAGYVAKGMVGTGRLGQEERPVRLMSRGIGKIGATLVAAAAEPYGNAVDVPSVVRIGGKLMPLDRYLRLRMRRLWGRSSYEPEGASSDRRARQEEVTEDDRRQAGWRAQRRLEIMKAKGSL